MGPDPYLGRAIRSLGESMGGQSRVATPGNRRRVVPRKALSVPHEPTLHDIDFDYTGAVQTFHVPMTIIPYSDSPTPSILMSGIGGRTGGFGPVAAAVGEVPVTPGETLRIYVGERSGDEFGLVIRQAGGWNGGGDGGDDGPGGAGATDVRRGGTALADRIFVAGGNGGYNGGAPDGVGVPGGSDGTGNYGVDPGATQSAGGVGSASTGTLGLGGDGTNDGPGGGGGYYGGGGMDTFLPPAGGGSSFVDPSAYNILYFHNNNPGGDGRMSFEYYA